MNRLLICSIRFLFILLFLLACEKTPQEVTSNTSTQKTTVREKNNSAQDRKEIQPGIYDVGNYFLIGDLLLSKRDPGHLKIASHYINDKSIIASLQDSIASVGYATKVDGVKLWPNGVVFYTFTEEVGQNSALKARIYKAMKMWSDVSTIRFENKEIVGRLFLFWKVRRHVVFFRSNENNSTLGMVGDARINLTDNVSVGTIAHEIGHTLGFPHEHQRPDRDNYIRIIENNIQNNYKSDFERIRYETPFIPWFTSARSGKAITPYDWESIMHYRQKAFNIRRGQKTIEIKNTRALGNIDANVIGQRDYLSIHDAQAVNYLYGKRIPSAPPKVEGLTSSPPYNYFISLRWNPVQSEITTKYEIRISTNPNQINHYIYHPRIRKPIPTLSLEKASTINMDNFYNVKLPPTNKKYYWKVRTYNYGSFTDSEVHSFYFRPPKKYYKPTLKEVTRNTNRNPVLHWDVPKGATGYNVYCSIKYYKKGMPNSWSPYSRVATNVQTKTWTDRRFRRKSWKGKPEVVMTYKVQSLGWWGGSNFSEVIGAESDTYL